MKKFGTVLAIVVVFVLMAIFIPKVKSIHTLKEENGGYIFVNNNLWDITYSGWNAGYSYGDMETVNEDVKELLKTKQYKDQDTVKIVMNARKNLNVQVLAIKKQ